MFLSTFLNFKFLYQNKREETVRDALDLWPMCHRQARGFSPQVVSVSTWCGCGLSPNTSLPLPSLKPYQSNAQYLEDTTCFGIEHTSIFIFRFSSFIEPGLGPQLYTMLPAGVRRLVAGVTPYLCLLMAVVTLGPNQFGFHIVRFFFIPLHIFIEGSRLAS